MLTTLLHVHVFISTYVCTGAFQNILVGIEDSAIQSQLIELIVRTLEESLDRDPDHMFQFSVKRDRVIDETQSQNGTESGIIPQMDSQKVHVSILVVHTYVHHHVACMYMYMYIYIYSTSTRHGASTCVLVFENILSTKTTNRLYKSFVHLRSLRLIKSVF